MKINFTPAEYDLLRQVADHWGSTPAALAHEWVMRAAATQYTLLKASVGRDGNLGRDGAIPPRSPVEPRPATTDGTTT